MTAIQRQIDSLRTSGLLGQLIRFGIAGVISSAIYAAVYLPLADFVVGAKLAVLAVPPAFVISATCGFFMHSKWSFKDHGTRDSSGRQHLKFFAVQGFGMALNLVFTWIITGPLFHGATWLPLVPSIFLTPLATFSLNRQLVFK